MNYPQEKIKPYSNDGKKSEQVEQMFDNIAPAYDQLNHTLSLGIDRSWRRKAINWLKPFRPQQIMDVATGTGDFAILACHELQPEQLIGTDISEGMMNVGREKVKKEGLSEKYLLQGKTVPLSRLPTTASTLSPLLLVSVILKIWIKDFLKCTVSSKQADI